ncbi:Predicted membrane protein [Nocardia africana]|uniref:Predicted membrane protein n=1 Tax=Nocardia africana TaxID=134964 RepID=A0A378X3W7_9NOCA|nr:Predicted membrane protein [Nocardia africana]
MSERSERAGRPDKPIARQRLETPVESRFRFEIDPEAVARGSETVARFLGTGRYLLLQTVVVVVWIGLNVFAVSLQWDPYPFILLNLAFSTQAAYAAPLILLAQNRQDNRDKVSLEEDRRRAAQTKADTEFLARELARCGSRWARWLLATICAANSRTSKTLWRGSTSMRLWTTKMLSRRRSPRKVPIERGVEYRFRLK